MKRKDRLPLLAVISETLTPECAVWKRRSLPRVFHCAASGFIAGNCIGSWIRFGGRPVWPINLFTFSYLIQ
jgi:hypothetical protein